jgi:hypothetical protein
MAKALSGEPVAWGGFPGLRPSAGGPRSQDPAPRTARESPLSGRCSHDQRLLRPERDRSHADH